MKQTVAARLDNQVGLILLYIVYGLSLNIFIYTGYIHSIPMELEEAALTDGASVWTDLPADHLPAAHADERHRRHPHLRVGMERLHAAARHPLRPGGRTLPLAQYVFQGQFNTNYTVAFASYLMALAPLVLVYIFAQRWVISGVMRGAGK